MKLFGIPIRIDPSFLMIAAFLGIGRLDEPVALLSWVVVVFLSVLLHELGHAVAFRAFGDSPSIVLYGMGGLTYPSGGRPLSPLRHIVVSLAGPFAGFAVGVAVAAVSVAAFGQVLPRGESMAEQVVWDLLWVNIGWGIFNLLPILPLDGGNVMRSVFDLVSRRRAETVARAISLVLAGAIAVLALAIQWFWVVILGLFFAYENGSALYQHWKAQSDPKTAYDMARLLARSGRIDEAITWLERAVEAGFHDIYALANDPDLEPLRPLPEFQRLFQQIG